MKLIVFLLLIVHILLPQFSSVSAANLIGKDCGISYDPNNPKARFDPRKNGCCEPIQEGIFDKIGGSLKDVIQCTLISIVPIVGGPFAGGACFTIKGMSWAAGFVISMNPELQKMDQLIKQAPIQKCASGQIQQDATSCKCIATDVPIDLCNRYFSPRQVIENGQPVSGVTPRPEYQSCVNCINNQGIWTGLGCIFTQRDEFIKLIVFGWGMGLAGILAFLCIIYSAITLQISKGDPEKIKNARDRLTSCVIGLLVILFSVLFLRIIGVNIIGIPGFS